MAGQPKLLKLLIGFLLPLLLGSGGRGGWYKSQTHNASDQDGRGGGGGGGEGEGRRGEGREGVSGEGGELPSGYLPLFKDRNLLKAGLGPGLGWSFVGVGVVGVGAFPDITTEPDIFYGRTTSPSTTPMPPREFEAEVSPVFATYAIFIIHYEDTLNLTEVVLHYREKTDGSCHRAKLTINPETGLFGNKDAFENVEGRRGFEYRLGGLYRRQRYYVCVNAVPEDKNSSSMSRCISFLTADNDGDNDLYNLQGIFLVLGISTILMVVIMCCVGYEKLIHAKKDECFDFLCCRKRRRRGRGAKSSISPEPLVNQDLEDADKMESRPVSVVFGQRETFLITRPSDK
ncbi:uncharacterized protein LOC143020117 [Oratosquilla oratoria]|uniref:uncharacterized protein LOC143020117 n=1 Tax=Oratosquilla oratoria TaxID=337810 RepID=UPI003F75F618